MGARLRAPLQGAHAGGLVLRRSQKLLLVLGSLGALLATGVGSIPTTQATSSSIDALRARRAVLVAELAAMQPSLHVAGRALSGAESQYEAQQAKVLAQQARLNALNGQMLSLNQQLTSDQATVGQNKQALAKIIRATFESTGNNQMLAAVLSANNFGQAMDRLRNATQVSQQVTDLVTRLSAQEDEIRRDQAKITADFAQASTIESQLADDSNRLLSFLVQRNNFFGSLSGPARQIAAEISSIDEQIAWQQSGGHVGAGPCGDHFAYGQCTWYVASRRCVPWGGNARDWYYNAAARGFKEGHTPIAGAVVVFWPGGDGASRSFGHVAYVEAVGPAAGIPGGYFKLSEMNFNGWNRVNYRVLPNNSGGIQGFIYGQ
jgi:surface antigen